MPSNLWSGDFECVRAANVPEHAVVLGCGNGKENWGQVMQIGKPVRTIVVRPLELPVEQLTRELEPDLLESPDPAKEPEAGGSHVVSILDYISPIVGYRVWTWDTTGLKSLCAQRWHPGQALEARCKASTVVGTIAGRTETANDTHDAPEANCTCGIHAAKTFDHFRKGGYERYGIHGEVYLWGKVVQHELGYRAQFAYPRNLIIPTELLLLSSAPILNRLQGLVAYGINIFVADDNGSIPLWTAHSGLNSAGLDQLIEIGDENYDRRHRHDARLDCGWGSSQRRCEASQPPPASAKASELPNEPNLLSRRPLPSDASTRNLSIVQDESNI